MSKSAPAAPNYTAAAQATAASSQQTTDAQTFANRPTVTTPWSTQSWTNSPTVDPATGQTVDTWASNTTLAPQAQTALNSQLGVQSGLSGEANSLLNQNANELNKPVDWSSFTPTGAAPQAQTYNAPQLSTQLQDTSGGFANQAANAAWQQYNQRNQPIQQTQQDNLKTQLYNEGLKEGDPAYDAAMKRLSQNQGDQNTQASLAATQTGIQGGATLQGEDLAAQGFGNSAAQSMFGDTLQGGAQTFGQNLSASNYQDQLRQQQISEDLQQRGFTLNEINSLLNGQQVGTGPSVQFNAAGASQPVNYSNAAAQQYAANTNAANIGNANTAGWLSSLGTLGGFI